MDDYPSSEETQSKMRASRNPRTVRPSVTSKKRSSAKHGTENQENQTLPVGDSPEFAAVEHPISTTPESSSESNEKDNDKSEKSPAESVRDFIITNLVVLAVAFAFLQLESFSDTGKAKLRSADAVVIQSLNNLQPGLIASDFYTRLTMVHGLVIYQWDAPFNAQIAQYRAEGLDDNGNSIASSNPDPDAFKTGDLTHIMQAEHDLTAVTPYDSAHDPNIDRYVLIKGTNIFTLMLGLPDAYIFVFRQLLPHNSLLVTASLAALVFALIRYIWLKTDEKKDGWGLVIWLIGLPLLVSGLEWAVKSAGLGAANALQNWASAPAIAVTGSLGVTPTVSWAANKLAEHHTFEFANRSLRRAVFKEVEEVEKEGHL
jgi:hypothetical protein